VGLDAFDGTVMAVTHDRWFAADFDRFLVFGSDGTVYESPEPGLGRDQGGPPALKSWYARRVSSASRAHARVITAK
jgi:ATPase subunit of ABC transporter with duplicated ATPase domains